MHPDAMLARRQEGRAAQPAAHLQHPHCGLQTQARDARRGAVSASRADEVLAVDRLGDGFGLVASRCAPGALMSVIGDRSKIAPGEPTRY
jgi:hypothetical protein